MKIRAYIRMSGIAFCALLVGLPIGYRGYTYLWFRQNPRFYATGLFHEKPVQDVYRGFTRLATLDALAGCDERPVPAAALRTQEEVIDFIEASSRKAGLNPPMDLARARLAHHQVKAAELRSDRDGMAKNSIKEVEYLKAAGWLHPSPAELGAVIAQTYRCDVPKPETKESR